jgi:hypothetical protein
MKNHMLLALLFVLFLGTGLANAAKKTISLASFVNDSWCGRTLLGCGTFPYGTKHYDGMTYAIQGNKQGTASTAWFASVAANQGSGAVSITIPVNVAKVKTVYTLMNTEWGSTQSGLITVTFTGSGGATWTVDLTGGVNVRDYNNGNYTNTCLCQLPGGVGQSGAINAWTNGSSPQRLDEQLYELPASFASQTLESITITDNGGENVQRAILAAVAVSTTAP